MSQQIDAEICVKNLQVFLGRWKHLPPDDIIDVCIDRIKLQAAFAAHGFDQSRDSTHNTENFADQIAGSLREGKT